MKKLILSGVLVWSVTALQAETIVWYRFDSANGTTVVNAANPGVHDGTFASLDDWTKNNESFGTMEALYPVYGGDVFETGAGILDPVSKTYHAVGQTLKWTKKSHPGLVWAPWSASYPQRNMTIEAFVRLPEDAHRSSSSGPAMHPIAQLGLDCSSGWIFSIYNGKPFFRWCAKQADGTKASTALTMNLDEANASTLPDDFTLYDGKYHHVAATIDNSGHTRLFLDYREIASKGAPSSYKDQDGNWVGLYFDHTNYRNDLMLGAHYCEPGRSLYGEIGEVRLSTTALTHDLFLRPVPAAEVDADTEIFLPIGDCSWFGQPLVQGCENRYWEILNASKNVNAARVEWAWPESEVPENWPNRVAYEPETSLRMAAVPAGVARPDTGAVQFRYNAGKGFVLRVEKTDPDLTAGDFTLEWFFKVGDVTSYSGALVMFSGPWAKLMVNNTGYLYTRMIDDVSTMYNHEYKGTRVDDNQWHHYALVYHHAQKSYEAFLDHRKVHFGTLKADRVLHKDTTKVFGGHTSTQQVFPGQLDNLRMTRRALAAFEFMTRAPYVSDVSLHARFEGNTSTGQSPHVAPAGELKALVDGEVPTYADVNHLIDLDHDGTYDEKSTKALKLNGGYVVFPHNTMLETRNATVEFFGKFSEVGNNAAFFRLGEVEATPGKVYANGTLSWGFYTPYVEGKHNLRVGASTSSEGLWSDKSREDINVARVSDFADGKWHHWAITVQTDETVTPKKTVFKVYRDYEPIGSTQFPLDADKGGILAFPDTGTSLAICSGAKVVGYLDDVRVRPGVWSTDTFMRRIPNGTLFLLR